MAKDLLKKMSWIFSGKEFTPEEKESRYELAREVRREIEKTVPKYRQNTMYNLLFFNLLTYTNNYNRIQKAKLIVNSSSVPN
jgi:hypothetical protein